MFSGSCALAFSAMLLAPGLGIGLEIQFALTFSHLTQAQFFKKVPRAPGSVGSVMCPASVLSFEANTFPLVS